MANPKVAMKTELEAKYRLKYEEKLKEAKKEFAHLLAEAHANYQRMLFMGMQQSHDAALMAADDVFDVNEYSAEKFHIAHIQYVNKISRMVVDDDKDDPEMVWTKATVDRRLLQIVGEKNFIPWDERMGGAEKAYNAEKCPYKKTNAERIRSMNDEELEVFLINVDLDKDVPFTTDWGKWLKQPVEDE